MKEFVFVYGTLKHGFGNHRVLDYSEFVGTGVTEQNYFLYHIGFPVASPNPKGRPVEGEVYLVTNPSVLESLDWLEGNGEFYTRQKRVITVNETESIDCWIYEIEGFTNERICPINKDGNYEWGGRESFSVNV